MVPALKALVVGVPVMAVHNRRKPPPIDRFKQTSKDAIEIAHARPFLSLDNQKEPICIGSAEHAPRHSESFPGQPCAKAGTRIPERGDYGPPLSRGRQRESILLPSNRI